MKKQKHFLKVILRFSVLMTLIVSTILQSMPRTAKAGYDPTYGWDFYEPLDSRNYSPHYFDLELDEEGFPHVLYFNDDLGELHYKYFDGTDWVSAHSLEVANTLAFVSLELDELSNPHIFAYYAPGTAISAFYTYYDGAGWNSTPLGFSFSTSQLGYTADFELDSSGTAKFAYYDETATALKVATWQGTTFISTETVESGKAASYIDMELDESDQPHFAYCQLTSNICSSMKYAGYTNASWSVETVENANTPGSAGNLASLAFDSLWRPHISYAVSNSKGFDLQYAQKGHDWLPQTVEHWTSFGAGFSAAIAVDQNDQPHIAYYDAVNAALDYVWKDGSSWNTNMDPEDTGMGTYMNLELDPNGNPTLAFFEESPSSISVYEYLPQPDLAVTNFWEDGLDLIGSIRNIGSGVFSNEIGVRLFVDGTQFGDEYWPPLEPIRPQEVFPFTLDKPVCPGAGPTMQVKVCLINPRDINPDNDCLEETWSCDNSPLVISDFVITAVAQTGFTASWTTNRPSDTRLTYTDGRSSQTYSDPTPLTNHSAEITGLNSHQVYYAQAFSTDFAGLSARSSRETVRTLAGTPGGIPNPTLFFDREDTRSEVYNLNAYYPDTSNIERVEFRFDGELVGTDFTPEDGTYTLQFPPGRHGYTRDEFYTLDHNLTADAFGFGAIDPEMYELPLEFQREYFPIESELLAPDPDSTITITEDTVPEGTVLDVQVFAQQYEWECAYGGADGLPACEDVANPVQKVEFYVDGAFRASDFLPVDGIYTYSWNISGLTPGDHHIHTKVIATDDGVQEHDADLHIVQRQTVLRTDRTIFRVDNTFRVHLRIFNNSASMNSVVISSVNEFMTGFQPIDQDYDTYKVVSNTQQDGTSANALMLLDQPLSLAPGQNLEFYYYVVPVLYDLTDSIPYYIGTTTINYEILGQQKTKEIVKNSQAFDGSSIPLTQSVANAFTSSDYLLITNPSKLYSLYTGNHVRKLLADMAWLAQLKQGVLAYISQETTKEALDLLLQDGSEWTTRLHPKFSQQYGGYVLLVGETEVIPSATTGPFDNDVYVNFSDHYYAATDSGAVLAPPDLLVGRVIGDTAVDLDKVLLNSIDTHLSDSYGRAQAYMGSGSEFRNKGTAVRADLSDLGYSVSIHHFEEELYFDRYEGIAFKAHDGLTRGDVDGDGTEEIIWAQDSTNKVFFIEPESGVATFGFSLDFEAGDSLAAGDVDADPQLEIIIADCNSTIRTYDVNGTQVASFSTGVQAWDKVAVGDLLYSNFGDEIVLAKGTEFLRIFSYTGTILTDLDLYTTGYLFSKYDHVKIGNITSDNSAGSEEIVFTDMLHDKVVVITGDWTVKQTFDRTLQEGDALEVANVEGDVFDSIILINSETGDMKAIDHGVVIPLHADPHDGLVRCKISGSSTDFVFHLDQEGHLDHIDMNYPDYSRQLFHDSIDDTDLIWFYAHGAPDGIWPIVTDTIPAAIYGSHPIVHAWSCSAGAYESKPGYLDDAFAENFLQAGAGAYLGSTETALGVEINAVNSNFYTDYWNLDGWKLAEAFARRESDLLVSSVDYALFMGWFVNEFNYYGDPKFDIFNSTLMDTANTIQNLNTALVIDLPAYTVSDLDGKDLVEIPPDEGLGTHSGTHYLEYDEYQVPIYIHTIEIPAGQKVQDVSLNAIGLKTSAWGVDLPLSEVIIVSAEGNAPAIPIKAENEIEAIPGHDWSPYFEQPYSWSLANHQEGGSTLKLVLYPFFYDPASQYSEYYRHFEFNIETIPSTFTVTEAKTNKSAYFPGDDIILSLAVNNSSTIPTDVVVRAAIQKGATGIPVDGFVLTALPASVDTALVDLSWNWADPSALPAGNYTIEIVIENMDGLRLAERTIGITLGVTQGAVSSFSVTPELFKPGDLIDINMDFTNLGDLPIDGEAVIQLQTLSGEIVSEFSQIFDSLAAESTKALAFTWSSTGATETDYRVVGFVRYASETTPAKMRYITTLTRILLPIILK